MSGRCPACYMTDSPRTQRITQVQMDCTHPWHSGQLSSPTPLLDRSGRVVVEVGGKLAERVYIHGIHEQSQTRLERAIDESTKRLEESPTEMANRHYETPSTLASIFSRLGIRGKVTAFHDAMGVPVKEVPAVPSEDRVRLRLSLIAEEFFEVMEAALSESHVYYAKTLVMAAIKHVTPQVNMVEFTDGLCDLDYVVEGTRLEFGIDGGPVLDEVHAANMRKTDGPIREDGKRLKPPGWVGPDIERVLKEQGWQG